MLAAGLLAVLFLATLSPPGGVGAHDCDPDATPADVHEDFRGDGVPCTESTHDDPHEHIIEVNGGRDVGRDEGLVFKAYVPEDNRYYDKADDSIVIRFDKSFDLPANGPILPDNLIMVDDSGDGDALGDAQNEITATVNGKELILNGDFFKLLNEGEYITIIIKAGTGIETPETPQGFDNFEGEKPYEVTITFVDGAVNPAVPKDAEDKNFVVVKNPISSTVPSATVRVELHTYAESPIESTDEIIVDFSGPSADSGFSLPTSMATSRIQVDYKKRMA